MKINTSNNTPSPDLTAPEACHLLDMDLYLASMEQQTDIAQGPDMSEQEAFDLLDNDTWRAEYPKFD